MPTKPAVSKKLSLALQGGGTHSAFSWGVIDHLLTDERLDIEAISATSGGAMIAVVLAQGLHDGGREGARDALEQFWHKVSIAAGMLPLRMNVVDKFLGHVGIDLSPSSMALDYITRIFSPSQFNLFDINPMRGIIEEMVDFDMLNKKSPVGLYINATHARSGKPIVFDHTTLSLDAVMASSCLPFIFKTVEIDDEPFWDGSFSGCPALTPLIHEVKASDILLVQVHPSYVEEVPTAAADILDRATEMSFHAVLMADLKNIELYNQTADNPVRVHRLEAGDMLTSLGRSSKLNAEWDFLTYLRDLGNQAAQDWTKDYFSQSSKVTHLRPSAKTA